MNQQEAFDRAALGVLTQGGPSTDAMGSCQYLSETGRMCGVGQLLPDDDTRRRWDSYGSVDDLPWDMIEEAGLSELGGDFLARLQLAHDKAAAAHGEFAGAFKRRMQRVAEEFHISSEVLL